MFLTYFQQFYELFQQEEERERDEPAAVAIVEDEVVRRESKNGGKGRKRPSLAVAGRGRRAVKRAREPAVLEVTILYIISWIRKCGTAICSCIRLFIKTNTRI